MFLRILLLNIIFCVSTWTNAEHAYDQYFYTAANTFNIPYCLLRSVIATEGGSVGEDVLHSNGAVDTGYAQFNKNGAWMNWLADNAGISYEQLRDNPGVAITAAAFVLRREADRKGGNVFYAVSAWHRGSKNYKDELGTIYLKRVNRKMELLIESGDCNNPSVYSKNIDANRVYTLPVSSLVLPKE